jgi:hypothetical protein
MNPFQTIFQSACFIKQKRTVDQYGFGHAKQRNHSTSNFSNLMLFFIDQINSNGKIKNLLCEMGL